MKFKLRFTKRARLSKNDFSFKITPTLWVIHKSTEKQKTFAINHNKKTKHKVMYKYTSIYLSWAIWNLILTVGEY